MAVAVHRLWTPQPHHRGSRTSRRPRIRRRSPPPRCLPGSCIRSVYVYISYTRTCRKSYPSSPWPMGSMGVGVGMGWAGLMRVEREEGPSSGGRKEGGGERWKAFSLKKASGRPKEPLRAFARARSDGVARNLVSQKLYIYTLFICYIILLYVMIIVI